MKFLGELILCHWYRSEWRFADCSDGLCCRKEREESTVETIFFFAENTDEAMIISNEKPSIKHHILIVFFCLHESNCRIYHTTIESINLLRSDNHKTVIMARFFSIHESWCFVQAALLSCHRWWPLRSLMPMSLVSKCTNAQTRIWLLRI